MGPQDLLDALDEIVYVSDPNTYELLYANRRCRSLLPTRDYKGKPCYALLQGQPAPCPYCKMCIRDRVEHVHGRALNGHQALVISGIQARDTAQQALCILMLGFVENFVRGAVFDNLTRIHDGDLFAHARHDAQVMGCLLYTSRCV